MTDKKRAPRVPGGRKMVAFKVLPDDLAQIDQFADEHGMSRTEYIIRSALKQPMDDRSLDARFEELEARIETLERMNGIA